MPESASTVSLLDGPFLPFVVPAQPFLPTVPVPPLPSCGDDRDISFISPSKISFSACGTGKILIEDASILSIYV
jgi:hypothetical protein